MPGFHDLKLGAHGVEREAVLLPLNGMWGYRTKCVGDAVREAGLSLTGVGIRGWQTRADVRVLVDERRDIVDLVMDDYPQVLLGRVL